MNPRARLGLLLLGAAGLVCPAFANDAPYPQGPVRLIIGFAPGGGVDLLARGLAKKLGERLSQPVIVENRPGAGGTIGTNAVAKAKPDGQTLLFTSVAHAINQSLYPTLPFDSVKDFVAVTPMATAPNGIAAHPGAPFKTLAELVDYARKNPGKVTYGAIGGSTTMYLGMALLEAMAGLKLQYVPYAGTMPSVQAAVTGEVQVVSSGYGSSEPFARSGQLRMLAVTTPRPSKLAPGVPTVAEAASLPGYEIVNWMGVFAPAGTPAATVDKLNTTIRDLQSDPEMLHIMASQKVEAFHLSPNDFRQLVQDDVRRYAKVVKDTNAQPQ